MAVMLPAGAPPAVTPPAVADQSESETPVSYAYAMFGHRVVSDFPLPVPPLAGDATSPPAAWTIRRAAGRDALPATPQDRLVHEDRCDGPCHEGRAFARVHRGPGGDWLWHESAGTCHVSPDGRRVTVHECDGADPGALALQLLGPVAGRALLRLGYPALHASAVVIRPGGGAVVFLGPSGQGKTTMGAAFLKRGATLLTDDVLPLWTGGTPAGTIMGGPGAPLLKLWDATAVHTLKITTTLPKLSAALEKKRLTPEGNFAQATAPVPLVAIYVLRRSDAAAGEEIEITPLDPRAALAVLMGQTYRGELLAPHEAATLLPLYARLAAQTPVRLLRYPNGFQYQDAVCARVAADAAGGEETRP